MKLEHNTILITGGSSGIGLELATQLIKLDNTVIVTGRDQAKLDATKRALPKVHTIQSDASDPGAISALYQGLISEFPDLNMIINNAGIMRKINLQDSGGDLNSIAGEIEINLSGPIRMVQQFLPHLATKQSAAIVNVSSGLAFIPLPISPVYSATKAGIHSYTQSLRVQLKNTSIKVFELAPPGTETPLFRGDFSEADLGGAKGMAVEELVRQAIEGLRKDVWEIRPGLSNVLYFMSRFAPNFMLRQLGKSVDVMLSMAKG